jgi:hypothetical protein
MRQRHFVLLTTLVFAMVACSGSDDDATTATDTQADDTTEATTPATVVTTSVPDTTVSATNEATESTVDVFSFAEDDLCEWVTGEEVARLVSTIYPWNGTAADGVPGPGSELPTNCSWSLSGGDGNGYLYAGDASRWVDFNGAPYDVAAAGPVVEYSEEDPAWIEIGTTVTGHPALSDGVGVFNGGFGQYAFWVPPEEQYLAYSLAVPGVGIEIDDHFFAVADGLLQELGWVAPTSPD